jgi:HK97 family phage prohead protease
MNENLKGVIEYKTVENGLQDVDTSKRVMIGMFANYNTPDLIGDVSTKGMFDRTWKEAKSRVKHLYEHDTTKMIGRIVDLWEDENGAYYKSIVPKHKFGDEVLEWAEAGLINEHSFGFVTKKSTKNKHGGRNLLEVLHTEVTSVGGGYAVHGSTPLLSVKKAFTVETLEGLAETMNAKHKALSNYCYKATASDDTIQDTEEKLSLLLLEIKQLQSIILDLKANSTPAAEEAQASQKGIMFDYKSVRAAIAIQHSF